MTNKEQYLRALKIKKAVDSKQPIWSFNKHGQVVEAEVILLSAEYDKYDLDKDYYSTYIRIATPNFYIEHNRDIREVSPEEVFLSKKEAIKYVDEMFERQEKELINKLKSISRELTELPSKKSFVLEELDTHDLPF